MKRVGDVESSESFELLDQMAGNIGVQSTIPLQPAVDAKTDRILASCSVDVNIGRSQCQSAVDQVKCRGDFAVRCEDRDGRIRSALCRLDLPNSQSRFFRAVL